jgi:hypothetical protein
MDTTSWENLKKYSFKQVISNIQIEINNNKMNKKYVKMLG